MDCVVAAGEREGNCVLHEALDWAAGIASDETAEWEIRLATASTMLDFHPMRHRSLLETLADRQSGPGMWFSRDDVQRAYADGGTDPEWHGWTDPWKFYRADEIAGRQARWAEEAAEDHVLPGENAEAETFALPYVRETQKVGRNDPCPCGSGKKYKKCCLGPGGS